jgi:hypothetical protein
MLFLLRVDGVFLRALLSARVARALSHGEQRLV